MESVLIAMAVLACPLGMGLCMWMMARGMRGAHKEGGGDSQTSVAELRREQEQIAARIEGLEASDGDGQRKLAHR